MAVVVVGSVTLLKKKGSGADCQEKTNTETKQKGNYMIRAGQKREQEVVVATRNKTSRRKTHNTTEQPVETETCKNTKKRQFFDMPRSIPSIGHLSFSELRERERKEDGHHAKDKDHGDKGGLLICRWQVPYA